MASYTKGKSVKLSKNFSSHEFDCKGKGCCSKTTVDPQLVQHLQKIRDKFGVSVTINSGYRCYTHNRAVGGATGSRHTKGMAADIVVKGIKPTEVAKYAESIGVLGIGLYDTFVHIDTRTHKSFWYSDKQEYRSTFGGAVKKGYSGTFPVLPKKGFFAKGDEGTQVANLQKFLNWYGGYKLTADGDFGAKTEQAVKMFQKAEKLVNDGKFGSTSLIKAKAIKK